MVNKGKQNIVVQNMAKFTEKLNVRLTKRQMTKLGVLAERTGTSKAEVVRNSIDTLLSDDHVVVPLEDRERKFIEGICNTAGVQPSKAVKMVLLSYHTLMSSPLWKIVKPVDKILEEMEGERTRMEEEMDS